MMLFVFQSWPTGIQCQLCHMMFSDQSAITAHYDVAHSDTTRRAKPGEGTHACDRCDKKFASKSSLAVHFRAVHAVGDVKTFKCDDCSKVFKYKHVLVRHVANVHKQ